MSNVFYDWEIGKSTVTDSYRQYHVPNALIYNIMKHNTLT